jgi:adenosylcobinamide-phosphate synthase
MSPLLRVPTERGLLLRVPTERGLLLRVPTATGLLLGVAGDLLLGDPGRGHPVALFGRAAAWLERRTHRDHRGAGTAHLLLAALPPTAVAALLAPRTAPVRRLTVTAASTAVALGGRSLRQEAMAVAAHLEDGDLDAARARLSSLCGRDPAALDAEGLARAVVESVAENTSDAVVATLWWGAVAGAVGLVGHRAVNTLDAMVGHRSPRYARFGWASARADDLLGLVPARVTALLTVLLAGTVGGRPGAAWRAWRRDAGGHPSPNAGPVEAATAGALGVRLGGAANRYPGHVDVRPAMGGPCPPGADDIARAVALSRAVSAAALLLAAGVAARREVRR